MVRKGNPALIVGGGAAGRRSRPSSRPSSRRSSFEIGLDINEEGEMIGACQGLDFELTCSDEVQSSPKTVRFESYTDIQQHSALTRGNRFGST